MSKSGVNEFAGLITPRAYFSTVGDYACKGTVSFLLFNFHTKKVDELEQMTA